MVPNIKAIVKVCEQYYLPKKVDYLLHFQAGGYWMALIDQYHINFHKLVFAFAECVGLCWIYGWKRFRNDIRAMIGDKIVDSMGFIFWPSMWVVGTPVLMLVGSSV